MFVTRRLQYQRAARQARKRRAAAATRGRRERPVSGVFVHVLSSADAYAREFELRVRMLNLEHSAYFGSSCASLLLPLAHLLALMCVGRRRSTYQGGSTH